MSCPFSGQDILTVDGKLTEIMMEKLRSKEELALINIANSLGIQFKKQSYGEVTTKPITLYALLLLAKGFVDWDKEQRRDQ